MPLQRTTTNSWRSCSSSTSWRCSATAPAGRFWAGCGRCRTNASLAHPDLAAAAAMAAVLYSGGAIELRRFLRIVDQAHGEDDERSESYGENWALVARALTFEGGVGRAVLDGRRAVELAQAGSDDVLTGAQAALARALYFAGDPGEARSLALRVVAHPDIDHRAPSLTHAHTTLALVALELGRIASAHGHAEKAKAAVGRIGTSRSWLGANASAAFGAVLAGEGNLVEAEHELATSEHLFRDEVASLHHGVDPRSPRSCARPTRASRRGGGDSAYRSGFLGGARRQRACSCARPGSGGRARGGESAGPQRRPARTTQRG